MAGPDRHCHRHHKTNGEGRRCEINEVKLRKNRTWGTLDRVDCTQWRKPQQPDTTDTQGDDDDGGGGGEKAPTVLFIAFDRSALHTKLRK